MRLLDAYWTPTVNYLWVECDCGALLNHPSKVSMCKCPKCGRAELWHGVDPTWAGSYYGEPVMQSQWEPRAA